MKLIDNCQYSIFFAVLQQNISLRTLKYSTLQVKVNGKQFKLNPENSACNAHCFVEGARKI